jgi:hypothetical protein
MQPEPLKIIGEDVVGAEQALDNSSPRGVPQVNGTARDTVDHAAAGMIT